MSLEKFKRDSLLDKIEAKENKVSETSEKEDENKGRSKTKAKK